MERTRATDLLAIVRAYSDAQERCEGAPFGTYVWPQMDPGIAISEIVVFCVEGDHGWVYIDGDIAYEVRDIGQAFWHAVAAHALPIHDEVEMHRLGADVVHKEDG